MRCSGVEWIQLAQNWIHCRAVVNTVVDLHIPYRVGHILIIYIY
jgi:hypothetical protein